MEYNDLKEQKNTNNEESIVKQDQASTISNKASINHSLTNEQKLEYLTNIIQNVEQELKTNGARKRLIKKDDDL